MAAPGPLTNLSVSKLAAPETLIGVSNSWLAQPRRISGLPSKALLPPDFRNCALELKSAGARALSVNCGARAGCSRPGVVAKTLSGRNGVFCCGVANTASNRLSWPPCRPALLLAVCAIATPAPMTVDNGAAAHTAARNRLRQYRVMPLSPRSRTSRAGAMRQRQRFAGAGGPTGAFLAAPRPAPRAIARRCVGRASPPRRQLDRPAATALRPCPRRRHASACWRCGSNPSCRHCAVRAGPECGRSRTPSLMARATPRSTRYRGSSPNKNICSRLYKGRADPAAMQDRQRPRERIHIDVTRCADQRLISREAAERAGSVAEVCNGKVADGRQVQIHQSQICTPKTTSGLSL